MGGADRSSQVSRSILLYSTDAIHVTVLGDARYDEATRSLLFPMEALDEKAVVDIDSVACDLGRVRIIDVCQDGQQIALPTATIV